MRLINTLMAFISGISILFSAAYAVVRIETQINNLKIEVQEINVNLVSLNHKVNVNIQDLEILMKLLEKSHVI